MTRFVVLVVTVAVTSAMLTGLLRRYATRYGVLDVPNPRSAHTVPIPRGGGMAIMAAFLGAVAWLDSTGALPTAVATVLVAGGATIGLLGFVDDHRSIAIAWRLVVQFAVAAGIVYWLGGVPALGIAGAAIDLGWPGHVLGVLALVWLVNLYNFMDGIDGLAATQAVTAGVSAAALYAGHPTAAGECALPLLLATAAAGFLYWNWPPAQIFMGDAGSGFLGLVVGVLALHSARLAPELPWMWAILMGVFVVDATVTLLRRLQQGRAIEGHRQHAYQHLAARLGAHHRVTMAVVAINVLWLLPIAALVARGRLGGAAGALIAYGPLIWIALLLKAGQAGAAAAGPGAIVRP